MVHQITTASGEQVILGGTNGLAIVASKSEPGRWHPVRVSGDVSQCDCLGFQHKGTCRHVKVVRALAAQPVATAQPNPTFELVEAMLAGAFDHLPKRRENLSIVDVIEGEFTSFEEWRERKAVAG